MGELTSLFVVDALDISVIHSVAHEDVYPGQHSKPINMDIVGDSVLITFGSSLEQTLGWVGYVVKQLNDATVSEVEIEIPTTSVGVFLTCAKSNGTVGMAYNLLEDENWNGYFFNTENVLKGSWTF